MNPVVRMGNGQPLTRERSADEPNGSPLADQPGGTAGAAADGSVEALLERLVSGRIASRIAAHDAAIWGPEAEAEARIRLGWTDASARAAELLSGIAELRSDFASRGIDRIVLCGMGGSSLAPEVITRHDGVGLVVLDSTHPDQVRRALSGDLARTAVVVSSKSGSTIETRSHRATFAQAFRDAGIDPADRIVVVTDPGSPLEASARDAGQRVFISDPNVGGRYSALTAFGLVPSGLAGADVAALVAEAEGVREALATDAPENPALQLAAAIAVGLPERFALAIAEAADARWGLGDWIEQLVAESTGKSGQGVLPVVLDPAAPELVEGLPTTALGVTVGAVDNGEVPSAPRLDLSASGPLGAQMLTWEVATAALGFLMGIDPFDQPDVESAKVAARAALDDAHGTIPAIGAIGDSSGTADLGIEVLAAPSGALPATIAELIASLRAAVGPAGYLAIQAYLDREGGTSEALHALRAAAAERLLAPVTFGWGPRFLHSTGQLHKGGPAVGVFLQILDAAEPELAIAESDSGFGELIAAQARGDRDVLVERGRPVFALRCADPAAAARTIAAAFSDAPSQGTEEASA
ncbi:MULTISPECIES: glucose-6-phosphate isomerase [unclassified Leucobacter]|uniref:glucose-6-phosphate isomerase n=1 Tax=unclassified Leucobacter TaxID=2621730 RepID=UPI000AE8760D|nr:glucose-6-phosphate isomerase [Leucobacter sp. Ag1]